MNRNQVDFSIDDFPALGAAVNSPSSSAPSPAIPAAIGVNRQSQNPSAIAKGRPNHTGGIMGGLNYASKAGNVVQAQSLSNFPSLTSALPAQQVLASNGTLPSSTSPTLTSNASTGQISPGDKYGLHGLINVIRMTDQDTNMVALGVDLTALGLNLNSGDNLHSNFMSPFSPDPTQGAEPVYALPACYSISHMTRNALLTKIPQMSDETLFYIFYGLPREQVQEAAAQDLYSRGWRFHKELKLWLTKDVYHDGAGVLKGNGFERGVYVFFDPTTWTRVKKEWVLYYDQLEERTLMQPSGSSTGTPVSGPFSIEANASNVDTSPTQAAQNISSSGSQSSMPMAPPGVSNSSSSNLNAQSNSVPANGMNISAGGFTGLMDPNQAAYRGNMWGGIHAVGSQSMPNANFFQQGSSQNQR